MFADYEKSNDLYKDAAYIVTYIHYMSLTGNFAKLRTRFEQSVRIPDYDSIF